MSVDLIEATLLIRDPDAAPAFVECDLCRRRSTEKANALLEAQFGPANRPDDRWENGVNLWRENRLNAMALECRKLLLSIHKTGDGTQLSEFDMQKLGWCFQEVRALFYPTKSNLEIVNDLVPRAVKLTDAAHKDEAVKILRQQKWWQD